MALPFSPRAYFHVDFYCPRVQFKMTVLYFLTKCKLMWGLELRHMLSLSIPFWSHPSLRKQLRAFTFTPLMTTDIKRLAKEQLRLGLALAEGNALKFTSANVFHEEDFPPNATFTPDRPGRTAEDTFVSGFKFFMSQKAQCAFSSLNKKVHAQSEPHQCQRQRTMWFYREQMLQK